MGGGEDVNVGNMVNSADEGGMDPDSLHAEEEACIAEEVELMMSIANDDL